MEQIVSRAADKSADWIVDTLFKAVLEHAGSEDPFDDQTVVAIKVKGSPAKRK